MVVIQVSIFADSPQSCPCYFQYLDNVHI